MKNNFVFILALVFTALGVFAANKPITPPGEGTEESPYLISKMEHLVWMQQDVENSYRKYYKLTCDLDASETKSWNNGKGFIPIGMETPSNKRFREKGIPVLLLSGAIECKPEELARTYDFAFSTSTARRTLEEAMKAGADDLYFTAVNAARLFQHTVRS